MMRTRTREDEAEKEREEEKGRKETNTFLQSSSTGRGTTTYLDQTGVRLFLTISRFFASST